MNFGAEVYPNLKNVIKERYVGDVTKSVQRVGLHLTTTGTAEECNWEDPLYWQVATGMDIAASEFFRFDFKSPNGIKRVITPAD